MASDARIEVTDMVELTEMPEMVELTEIPKMVEEIRRTAQEARPPCIVRVPEFLKRLNEGSYVPDLVGLGPYHHNINNDPNFDLESHKRRAREKALIRHRPYLPPLEHFRSVLSSHEMEIKAYYSHDFSFDADVFIDDAIFIIQLTFATIDDKVGDRFHPLLDYNMLHTSMGFKVWTDLLKLENQIPFFLLNNLGNVKDVLSALAISGILFPIKTNLETPEVDVMNELPPPRHLLEFVYCYLVKSMRTSSEAVSCSQSGNVHGMRDLWTSSEAVSSSQSGNVHGMGDLWKKMLRSIWTSYTSIFCLPKSKGRDGESKPEEDWAIPAATELHNVGIVFHESQEQNRLCFKEGHLYLPKLQLDDFSEVMFRNVMAFEEFCVEPGQRFFNNYVSLMKHLIHTEADAGLLIKHGVIKNDLENEQSVANLFRSITKFSTVDNVPEIREHIVNNIRNYYQKSQKSQNSQL